MIEDKKYDFVISIANGQFGMDEIAEWIEEHLIEIE
jgi:hypothetical protein